MKNKLTRFMLFLSITGILAMTSCKTDDPEPEPIVKPTPKPDPEPEALDTIKVASYKIVKPNLTEDSENMYEISIGYPTLEVTFNHPAEVTSIKPIFPFVTTFCAVRHQFVGKNRRSSPILCRSSKILENRVFFNSIIVPLFHIHFNIATK